MKSSGEIMEILEAYDATGSYRAAAELAGCAHHTVARYVRLRETGQSPVEREHRAPPIDAFVEKIEELVSRSNGRVRADVVHRRITAMLRRFLPKRAALETASDQTRLNAGYALRATLGLLAVLAFYISLSGIWTFVGGVANTSGIDAQTSSLVLSVATVLGIAGSAVATVLGARPGTRTNLLVGYLAMALSLGLLAGIPGLVRFTVAALLFKFTWTFILPYIMATLSGLDRSGRLVNVANIAIGGGFALGPLMGGRLVENTGGYGALIALSTAGLLLSLAMILAAQPHNSANLS